MRAVTVEEIERIAGGLKKLHPNALKADAQSSGTVHVTTTVTSGGYIPGGFGGTGTGGPPHNAPVIGGGGGGGAGNPLDPDSGTWSQDADGQWSWSTDANGDVSFSTPYLSEMGGYVSGEYNVLSQNWEITDNFSDGTVLSFSQHAVTGDGTGPEAGHTEYEVQLSHTFTHGGATIQLSGNAGYTSGFGASVGAEVTVKY